MYANQQDIADKPFRALRIYRREPCHQLSFEDFFLPLGGKLGSPRFGGQ